MMSLVHQRLRSDLRFWASDGSDRWDESEPRPPWVCGFLVLAVALNPTSLQACAACYGQSDAPMAAGMNWGILSLLGVVVMVLGSIAAFFVYLARRSATIAAANSAKPAVLATSGASWVRPRGASVPGRSGIRKRWLFVAYRCAGRIGHCCARRQAHSGAAALGGARKITPGVN
jgi:hypothetical protein